MFSRHTSTLREIEGEDTDQGQEENSQPQPPGMTPSKQERKMKKREEQPQRREHRHIEQNQQSDGEYFDLNVLKGAVSFNTKPFKHRELVWIGFKKVLLFPFCWNWWMVRISRARYLAGCTLYILHNLYTWLYIRGCLPRQQQQQLPDSAILVGDRLDMDVRVTQIQILLPYVLAILFGIGYGSVVAASGWEALRIPPYPRRGGTGSKSGDNSGNGDDRIARSYFNREIDEKQRRRRRRRQQQTHPEVVDYDDEDYDMDDEEEESPVSLGGQGGNGHMGTTSGCTEDDETIGFRGNGARSSSTAIDADGADAAAVATEVGLLSTLDGGLTRVDRDSPDGNEFHLRDGIGSAGGEGSVASCDGGTSVGSSAGGGMAGLFHQTSFSGSEGDVIGEDEEEDEDGGGWGHVVVRPVKVARWDELGQRSKSYLSLNQLRALIIERAESIPQKITYRRAAKLGTLATVCLPALFTVCLMAARAWIDVGHSSSLSTVSEDSNCHDHDWFKIGACDGGIELETLALAVLWRAARAAWSLILRALRLDAGDVAATIVTVTSLCSVAFIALPTFRALENAERTYQRRYMYSKFFCALTSSQRARKHRLPHFSLKNVANIRVWLALRAGKTWLRRHKRERSADAVVSLAFFLSLALLTAILFEALSNRETRFLSTLVHWELLVWCCSISFFLLRYLTLGAETNDRYRDTSVLLTEQINVQLRILQNSANQDSNKSSKRERLGVSSKVLELATKLLKELDGPNKLSGLSMNPLLYNVTRAVLVSALSGVMSDTLGFSVKLYKVLSYK